MTSYTASMWRRSSRCDTSACVEIRFRKSSRSLTDDCVEVGFRKSSRSYDTDCVEVGFAKSSRCGAGDCVEVGFRKSSQSGGNGACVEVGSCDCDGGEVLVRDSKDPQGPVLQFPRERFTEFLAGVKAGQFD